MGHASDHLPTGHEKYEKIADIRRTNTELDDKIREIRDRVRG